MAASRKICKFMLFGLLAVSSAILLRKAFTISASLRSSKTSKERAERGILRKNPAATQLSICSATAETERRPSAAWISR